MQIEVVIERDPTGRLHGYVRQRRPDGYVYHGDDMLKDRTVHTATDARQECARQLAEIYVLSPLPKITYVMPEGE